MKKIFIILSILSLFVGCASNKVSIKQKEERKSLEIMYAPQKEEFINLLNSPELTKSDWENLRFLYGYCAKGNKEAGIEMSRLWLEEFLKDKTPRKHDNFTGKFINNSDKKLKIGIMSKSNSWTRWFYLEVPPHDEKYFTIPDLVKKHDTYIAIKQPEQWFIYKAGEHLDKWIDDPEEWLNVFWNTYCEYANYVFDTYSLEFIYDDNSINKNYDWKFVSRYENEKNILQEVDYDTELSKLFGSSR